jgi:hypothetical protein
MIVNRGAIRTQQISSNSRAIAALTLARESVPTFFPRTDDVAKIFFREARVSQPQRESVVRVDQKILPNEVCREIE